MGVIHAYCICPQVLTWATTSGDKYTISIVTISIISLKNHSTCIVSQHVASHSTTNMGVAPSGGKRKTGAIVIHTHPTASCFVAFRDVMKTIWTLDCSISHVYTRLSFWSRNPYSTSITFTTVFCRSLIRESLQVQLGRTWLVQHKKSAEWSSTFIAPICELSLWAKPYSVTTRPHQNVLLKMKLHDLNCMKHRVMWWSDVVSCTGCASMQLQHT